MPNFTYGGAAVELNFAAEFPCRLQLMGAPASSWGDYSKRKGLSDALTLGPIYILPQWL